MIKPLTNPGRRLRIVALPLGGGKARSKCRTLVTDWTPAQFVRFLDDAIRRHAPDFERGRKERTRR